MYPTMLEFSVEATYPNDEAIVTAIIMVLSAIQGVIVIELQQVFATKYDPRKGIEVRRRFMDQKGVTFISGPTNSRKLARNLRNH